MPYLMVNLSDPRDCRDAIHRLRDAIHQAGGSAAAGKKAAPRSPSPAQRERGRSVVPASDDATREQGSVSDFRPVSSSKVRSSAPARPEEDLHDLPLPNKLSRISQRGVFRHLLRIATEVSTPMSLPELDRQLGFQPNKMRSLKAIMAKLEHRFGLRFLVADPEGSADEAGNPRYIMPPRMRNQILRVAG